MGRLRELAIFSASFLLLASPVKAATCDYEVKAKLNNEVANIKANYEIKERELDPNEYGIPDVLIGTEEEENWVPKEGYYQINILNLTENFYVEVKNEVTGETKTYTYADSNNGNINFEYRDASVVTKFTFTIKASDITGCDGNTYKTINLSTPRYNDYAEYSMCDTLKDYYLCQYFVTFDELDFSDFTTKINKELERRSKDSVTEDKLKWYQNVGNFVKEHKVAFIVGGVIVVAGGATAAVVIIRRRRRSEI